MRAKLLEAGTKSVKKLRAKEFKLSNQTIKLIENRRKLMNENKKRTTEINKLIMRRPKRI